MAKKQVKSVEIGPARTAECPLFSPKQTFARGDLDSVSMSAFGHKQSFAYFGDPCILCGDGARYDQNWLLPKPQPAAHFYELGLVEDGVRIPICLYSVQILEVASECSAFGLST